MFASDMESCRHNADLSSHFRTCQEIVTVCGGNCNAKSTKYKLRRFHHPLRFTSTSTFTRRMTGFCSS